MQESPFCSQTVRALVQALKHRPCRRMHVPGNIETDPIYSAHMAAGLGTAASKHVPHSYVYGMLLGSAPQLAGNPALTATSLHHAAGTTAIICESTAAQMLLGTKTREPYMRKQLLDLPDTHGCRFSEKIDSCCFHIGSRKQHPLDSSTACATLHTTYV